MHNIFIFLLGILLLISCKEKPKRPDYIIPEAKFVRILIDFNLAQGMNSTNLFRKKVEYFKEYNLIDSLFKSHGVSRASFDSTLAFYVNDPVKMDALYDKVISEFSRKAAAIQSKMDKKKKAEEQKKPK